MLTSQSIYRLTSEKQLTMQAQSEADRPEIHPSPGGGVELRSKNSTRHSHVRFVNMTSRRVDVIWINYEGLRVKYRTLDPAEYFDVTSFVTHPWIFLDSETHTRLVVSSKEVFDIPEPVYVRAREGAPQATRAYVKITLPLYSLKEISLQVIQKCLRNPQDAFELEIPTFLQRDLHSRCSMASRN